MKKFKVICACIIAMMIVAGSAMQAVSEAMKVTAGKVQGTVEVSIDGSEWNTVATGDEIPIGATVRTKAESSCILKWADGNAVKVAPISITKVEEADRAASGREKSALSLEKGKVFAHAKKLATPDSSFELRTPTAVAGVRGSDLYGMMSGGAANFGVTDGSLTVEAGGQEVVVEVGFSVNIDPTGNISPPEPIPPAVLQEVKQNTQEAKQEAQAEAKAEKKEEKAAKKEEKAEQKEEKKEEKAAEQEAKSSEQTTEENAESTSEQQAEDTMTDDIAAGVEDATETATSALDDAELGGQASDASNAGMITGTVDVTIHVDGQ